MSERVCVCSLTITSNPPPPLKKKTVGDLEDGVRKETLELGYVLQWLLEFWAGLGVSCGLIQYDGFIGVLKGLL